MPKTFLKKALKILPSKTPASHKKLLEEFIYRTPVEDLGDLDAEGFLHIIQMQWDLAQKRAPAKPKIGISCSLQKNQKCRDTYIEIVSDDLAFLVDSVVAEINRHNLLIDILLHPTIHAKYDKANNLVDITDKPGEGYRKQSHIHIQIRNAVPDEFLQELEAELYDVIADVYMANRDWQKMLGVLAEARDELSTARTPEAAKDIQEYCDFLEYLHGNNFTLLGYREYEFVSQKGELKSKTVKGKGLGLLAEDVKPAYISDSKEGLPRNLQELRRDLPALSVSKTNRVSTVHRRVPMDAVAIKTYDNKGRVKGEKLFLGLFTSVTYSRSVMDVPLLREKVDGVVKLARFDQRSHDGKALRHILEKYPRDELFQIDEKELLEVCASILRLQERQRLALFMRSDPFRRYISCLVYVPRDRFSSELRQNIGEILERELNGACGNFYTSLDDSVFARVMFVINVKQDNPLDFNNADIERQLQEAARTWQEKLNVALSGALKNEEDILRLTFKYGEAFPVSYSYRYTPKSAVFDIHKIEEVLKEKRLNVDLYCPADMPANQFRLKVYNPNKPLTLAAVMPIMEHMGFRAISEYPFEIRPKAKKCSVWMHDFLLENPSGNSLSIEDIKENLEEAFVQIWYKGIDSDNLNKLVAGADMTWRETTILRSYVRYLRQIGYPFSRPYIERALTDHPKIARAFVDLFRLLHDPKKQADAKSKEKSSLAAIDKMLEAVESLDQDRILRSIKNLIESTLRTNYFQTIEDENGQQPKSYLSLKFDSKQIEDLPEPKPYREIFVYSTRVEGIHLRGDVIARGGIRWSDRHEDFRTEVLGLMKAQMVKNSVIVPMGAKGGFVVKTATKSRDEFREEGIECYKIFIRGLLDITDNRIGNKVKTPENVVCRDAEDPYLVVAADKGTASFSDIANGLSEEYGFWLADAFASGGSAGYDHKKMGITARGAWESVKLHFRQLNHNTQEQPFDVIGVGDMGGDVFGNGMLLSEEICLVGAFNHLHIFCDPEPDAAQSFKERKRLFDNVMGWDQYNEKLLSKGGRIYSRSDKVLTLTPEIKKRFDIEKDKVSPYELMRAMLRGRGDLLWFGGIGTYIKSSKETDSDVGDKANDAIRINAKEVRAKVIGEGANLGVTQRGRIEFCEHGGRINTDFLDNSGGVDSSDHEVNIKILMSGVMNNPKYHMAIKSRNNLLEKMTDEIAAHVLRNNYQQALAISMSEYKARENLQPQQEFIQFMEREHNLDREIEGLPDDETIEQRTRIGRGLTRPELCVILSYAKITFTKELLASDIPDNADMQSWLLDYFPDVLKEKYVEEIKRHRLAREIVATTMANSLVNRMGPSFLHSRMKKTGASAADIARSYIIVRDAFQLRPLWDRIEALDNKVPADVQLRAMYEISQLAKHAVTWLLTRLGRDVDISRDIKNFADGVQQMCENIDEILTPDLKQGLNERTSSNIRNGIPEDLARDVAMVPLLISAFDIIHTSLHNKADLLHTARTYYEIGEVFHLDWLRQKANFLSSDDHWYAEATDGLVDQLYSCQAGLAARVLNDTGGKAGKYDTLVQKWMADHQHPIDQLMPLFAQLRGTGTMELPHLVIAEQRLRSLYGG